MDMSLVTGILAMQAGSTQTQVVTAIMKSNEDAEKFAVQTLLGAGGSNAPSSANLAAGIGGNLDISA
jgi:hypothetical protein